MLSYSKISKRTQSFFKIVIVFLFAITLAFGQISKNVESNFKLCVIDVGQGDSILLQYKGQNFLVDAADKLDKDIVHKKLLPYLNYQGVNVLDGVFLTHPHYDHFGGLVALLREKEVKTIFLHRSFWFSMDHSLRNLQKTIAELKISEKQIGQGTKLNFDKDFSIEVLHPDNMYTHKKTNNYSLVLLVKYLDKRFLLCGDIERDAEKYLLATSQDLHADVIKIAHHGSNTSSTEAFLRKVNPQIAIISVGKGNEFHHPHGQVINRLRKLGLKIYRTDLHGTVQVFVKDGQILVQTDN